MSGSLFFYQLHCPRPSRLPLSQTSFCSKSHNFLSSLCTWKLSLLWGTRMCILYINNLYLQPLAFVRCLNGVLLPVAHFFPPTNGTYRSCWLLPDCRGLLTARYTAVCASVTLADVSNLFLVSNQLTCSSPHQLHQLEQTSNLLLLWSRCPKNYRDEQALLFLPPRSSSYRLLPLQPPGLLFFPPGCRCWGTKIQMLIWIFLPPQIWTIPIPPRLICSCSLCFSLYLFPVWVLLSSGVICPLSRSHMVEKRLHGSNLARWDAACSLFLTLHFCIPASHHKMCSEHVQRFYIQEPVQMSENMAIQWDCTRTTICVSISLQFRSN